MTNPDLTHLALVVDRSGSMQTIYRDMNGAIANLLTEQEALDGAIDLSVLTFDDTYEWTHRNVNLHDEKAHGFEKPWIVPRGMTALHDAVGATVTALGAQFAALEEGDRPGKVIVVVVTDGGENSSREYTGEQIKALVKQQTDEWGWTFLYLAANVDAFATGATMGFAKGQSIGYAANAVGTQSVYAAASAAVTRTRKGGSAAFTDEEREAAQ